MKSHTNSTERKHFSQTIFTQALISQVVFQFYWEKVYELHISECMHYAGEYKIETDSNVNRKSRLAGQKYTLNSAS